MLKAAAVAKLLGISQRAVYDLAASGRLACYRVGVDGGAVRFDQADVDAYLASTRPEATRLLPARVLREYERLRKAAADESGASELPELTPEQLAIAAKRYRRMRRAPWANADKIAAIYQQAKLLTEQTGTQHHVDHVVPLVGEFVSGLHVETNLQVLPATDNIKKSNRIETK